jgi:hypothetical protein
MKYEEEWLGISPKDRFAFLTNFREARPPPIGSPSNERQGYKDSITQHSSLRPISSLRPAGLFSDWMAVHIEVARNS